MALAAVEDVGMGVIHAGIGRARARKAVARGRGRMARSTVHSVRRGPSCLFAFRRRQLCVYLGRVASVLARLRMTSVGPVPVNALETVQYSILLNEIRYSTQQRVSEREIRRLRDRVRDRFSLPSLGAWR